MKKTAYFIVLALIILTSIQPSSGQWTKSPHFFSGNIKAFTYIDNTLFACSEGGGVFSTEDDGKSWNTCNNGLVDLKLLSLTYANGKLIAGTTTMGCFISEDKGKSWQQQTGDTLKQATISCLAYNGFKLYTVIETKGIYESEDFGNTWKNIYRDKFNFYSNIPSITFFNNIIFVTTYNSFLLYSEDGKSWLSKTISKYVKKVYSVATKSDTIYVATDIGVYYTNSINKGFNGQNKGLPFFKEPFASKIIYSKKQYLIRALKNSIYLLNKQNIWTEISLGTEINNITNFGIKGNYLYAASSDGELWQRPLDDIKSSLTNKTYDYLNINNISARINSCGNFFWDFQNNFEFIAPKGSGKLANGDGHIWVGGKDKNELLHLAGERFRQQGIDFYQGPVMQPSHYKKYYEQWNKVWKINKSEIEDFKVNWTNKKYKIPESILTWPANGNIELGQSKILAPFFDNDKDSIYNPLKGDYPWIRGDQAIYFIINDDSIHTETGGRKLGIQKEYMSYAYFAPSDSALNNTIFINCRITNHSQNIYDSLYIGYSDELDNGEPWDNYVGCNVALNAFYSYNADKTDGNGLNNTYGEHPPALACILLNNEITNFMYYNNSSGLMGDPITASEYYNIMRSRWKGGSYLYYGGNGYNSNEETYGPECKYFCPGTTDSTLKGTNGIAPNGPVDWTEVIAKNYPFNKRGVGSTGPLTFLPGETKYFDMAITWARDYISDVDAYFSLPLLFERVAAVRNFYDKTTASDINKNNLVINSVNSTNISKVSVNIYPNPAKDIVNIKIAPYKPGLNYKIYNILGKTVYNGCINSDLTNVPVNNLNDGIYFINLFSFNESITHKIIINKKYK